MGNSVSMEEELMSQNGGLQYQVPGQVTTINHMMIDVVAGGHVQQNLL